MLDIELSNSNVSPGPDWEWIGNGYIDSNIGSWFNLRTGESLHFDPIHRGIGTHWDYKAPNGTKYRITLDGNISIKRK